MRLYIPECCQTPGQRTAFSKLWWRNGPSHLDNKYVSACFPQMGVRKWIARGPLLEGSGTQKEHTWFVVCSELCCYRAQKALNIMYARKLHRASYSILLGVDKIPSKTEAAVDIDNSESDSVSYLFDSAGD